MKEFLGLLGRSRQWFYDVKPSDYKPKIGDKLSYIFDDEDIELFNSLKKK